ncbi:MAG: hypothetical protein LBH37_00805 [Oscillospiraceae bacterium]|jgi:hypothetical protein|nr:hypothetical protein [Oscillospiraceae bacterium]
MVLNAVPEPLLDSANESILTICDDVEFNVEHETDSREHVSSCSSVILKDNAKLKVPRVRGPNVILGDNLKLTAPPTLVMAIMKKPGYTHRAIYAKNITLQ